MSEIMIEVHNVDLIALCHAIPCERCKAGVDQPCRKPDGESLSEGLPVRVHVERITPVWVVYRIGYRNGRRDMKREIHGKD